MSGRIHNNEVIGQQAVNLIEKLVLGMGFLWNPPGPFDAGIDGHIEIRDPETGSVAGRLLRVQSRARGRFAGENDESFSYVCTESEFEYWLRCDAPVLLICSHPERDEAWWVCIQQYFADVARRADRRVDFDKRTTRFDAGAAAPLAYLAGDRSPLRRQRTTQPEELVSNLLPLLHLPPTLYRAPTTCRVNAHAHARYEQAQKGRASDYVLRDAHIYSLRDPSGTPLEFLADGPAEALPVAAWTDDDAEGHRRLGDLLRRCLLQEHKRQLSWQPQRKLFYFRAPNPLADQHLVSSAGFKRLTVRLKYRGSDPSKVWFARHQGFAPRFIALGGRWYLEIEPDYYFSFDGEREHFDAAELSATLKRREKHKAVLGHLRMWEDYLTRPPSLLRVEPPLLQFGPLASFSVQTGFDDKAWDALAAAPATTPNQEQLAA